MLRPIDETTTDVALDVLSHGFPQRSRAFWQAGLDRARPYADESGWPLGYLLYLKDRPMGVLLALASRRQCQAGKDETVINLSGFYADPGARWAAGSMFRPFTVERAGLVVTDRAPFPHVARMVLALGFKPWTEGMILLPWPVAIAKSPPGFSRVLGFKDTPSGALDSARTKLLRDHDRLGCISAVLQTETTWSPLVFARRRIKGVNVGYLVYAPSRREVLAHRRTIALFLLRRGIHVLRLHADRSECPRGGVFREMGKMNLFRGDMSTDCVDLAYSEVVFFGFS